MTEAIAAISAWTTATIVEITGVTTAVATQIVTGVAETAIAAGLNYGIELITGGPPQPGGQKIAAGGSAEPNRHLFGRYRTFGVKSWQGGIAAKNGDDKHLNFAQMQVISSTPITEIERVLDADTVLVPVAEGMTGGGRFWAAAQKPYNRNLSSTKSRLYYWYSVGAAVGVRDPLLGWFADQSWQPLITPPYADPDGVLPKIPFWPDDNRGDGLATLSNTAYQDFKSFPQGPPNLSVIAKGIKCFDPRDDDQSADDPDTWQFTLCPALIAAWYVTRPFSFNASYDDVDMDTLISAANACDEMVETFASTGAAGSPPMEPRYACGGEIIESEDRDGTLAALCAAMAGSWAQVGGRWFFYAGAYTAPTTAIDNTWIMRNVEFTAQRSRLDLYNTADGTFMAEARRWQPSPYPQVQDAAALAADNGIAIYQTKDLAYVQSHTQAQRCLLIEIRRTHKPRRFKFDTPIGYAIRVVTGQSVSLTQQGFGYEIAAVPFKIASWAIGDQDDSGQIWVTLLLEEDGADIYESAIDDLTDADSLSDNAAGDDLISDGESDPAAPTGGIEGVYA